MADILTEKTITADPSRREFLTTVAAGGAVVATTALLKSPASAATPTTAPSSVSATPSAVPIVLTINGVDHPISVDPRISLLDTLRETLGMTGSKKGCDHGQCGACTVLVDDRRVNSCLTLAVSAAGQKVTTIEGLADGDKLHPVQSAFIEHDAFQCGYCTPGQICSAVGLIKEGHAKTDDDIRELMSGNICRCGAYVNIAAAVRDAMSHA